MLRWPDRAAVLAAAQRWAMAQSDAHPELLAIGCYGSYARNDWGVGSDLDIVAVVRHSDAPFERRALRWQLNALPVPADLLVYTAEEWRGLLRDDTRFGRTLRRETIWLWSAPDFESAAEHIAG